MCIPVREPHALSAEVEVRGWGDPQVILTILRPCTTGGTEGGRGKEGFGGGWLATGRRGPRFKGTENWRTEGGTA